jgi:ribosome-binding protein aMBF1 (putative translation factor)
MRSKDGRRKDGAGMSTLTIGRFIYKEHRESFGQRLRRIRKSKKLSQTALAEKTGIDNHAISNYEVGLILPSLSTLEWLCEALDVTATELLGF